MPKYKLGDIAALFPCPPKCKTKTGQKIQALFEEFYNKPSQKDQEKLTFECKKNQVGDTIRNAEEMNKLKREAKKRLSLSFEDAVRTKKVQQTAALFLPAKENFPISTLERSRMVPAMRKNLASFPLHKSEKESNLLPQDERKKMAKSVAPREKGEELASRTLFVGNLPMSTTRKSLERLFHPFGPLESCRLRGAVSTKATIPKKIADIKRKYHAGLHSRIGYVVLKNRKDALEAMSLSGMLLEGHHLVVDRVSAFGGKKVYDEKRAVFVGNLPFDVEDETLWSRFMQCGDVEAVRVIRDKETGVGKGFGYVLFQNIQGKEKALSLTNLEIGGRRSRIKCIEGVKKKQAFWKNAAKRVAQRSKLSGRKTLKKLAKKRKQQQQRKRISGIFKNLSKR